MASTLLSFLSCPLYLTAPQACFSEVGDPTYSQQAKHPKRMPLGSTLSRFFRVALDPQYYCALFVRKKCALYSTLFGSCTLSVLALCIQGLPSPQQLKSSSCLKYLNGHLLVVFGQL